MLNERIRIVITAANPANPTTDSAFKHPWIRNAKPKLSEVSALELSVHVDALFATLLRLIRMLDFYRQASICPHLKSASRPVFELRTNDFRTSAREQSFTLSNTRRPDNMHPNTRKSHRLEVFCPV